MGETCEDDMFQFSCLRIDGFCNFGVCVTVQVHPPAADGIEISIPFIVIQPGSFGVCNKYVFLFILLVGERMPDEAIV